MKIYQIHEYGGEWEDRFDYIVKSYLSKEKADAEMEQLKSDEELARKCNSCPLHFCPTECDGKCDQCSERSIERAKQYCDRYEPFDEDKYNPEEYDRDDKCINYDYHMDDHFFRIEEVDVIE